MFRSSSMAMISFFVLAQAVPAQEAKSPKSLEGLWAGTLKTGVVDLRLVFKITKKDGAFAGAMDSIDQGAKAIPIETIEIKDDVVTLKLKTIGGVFEGKLKEDGS